MSPSRGIESLLGAHIARTCREGRTRGRARDSALPRRALLPITWNVTRLNILPVPPRPSLPAFPPLASSPPSSFSLFLLPFASHLLSRYNILYACFPSFPSTCPLACTHERLSTRSGRGRNWRES